MQTANQHLVMEYAPPDLRSPSPTSSVGSRHPHDQTSLSDSENVLSQPQFEQKWRDKIGLGRLTPQETRAVNDPLLLPRPPPNSEEEKNQYMNTIQNLRREVRELHENELFEKTLLQGSKVALETPAYTTDIDAIMRSMMFPSTPASTSRRLNHPSPSSIHASPTAAHSSRARIHRASTYHPDANSQITKGPWNDTETTRGGFGAGMDSFAGVATATSGPGTVIPPPGVGIGRRTKGKGSSRR